MPNWAHSYLHSSIENIPEHASLRSSFDSATGLAEILCRSAGSGITPAGTENSFSEPLRTGLTRLGHFACLHPEIVRQRQVGIATAQQALTSGVLTPAQEIRDLKAQMAEMMVVMKQMQKMLLQKVNQ